MLHVGSLLQKPPLQVMATRLGPACPLPLPEATAKSSRRLFRRGATPLVGTGMPRYICFTAMACIAIFSLSTLF